MGRREWLALVGIAAAAGLAALWWEYRYTEPPGDPDLTGRVVKVNAPSRPGAVFGRGVWSVLVEPDPGVAPGKPVWVTVRREVPVGGPDGRAGVLAPGQRVRVWRWSLSELSNGEFACQARYVAITPDP
jgi:hypothetical protein